MIKSKLNLILTLVVPCVIGAAQSITTTGPKEPVNIGAQFKFAATLSAVTGPVQWSVSGGGTINGKSGLYVSPAAIPVPNTVTVQASAVGVSATYSFLLRRPPARIASWNPWSLPVGPFTLSISGNNFTADTTIPLGTIPVQTIYLNSYYLTVTGTIPAGSKGSVPISATLPGPGGGTYTSAYQVPIGSGGGGGGGGTPSIAISPASVTMVKSTTQQFTATLTNLAGAVNWSATAGSVTSAGLFTAPAAASTVTVKAVSATNAGVMASATVTVVDSFAQPTVTTLSPAALPFGPLNLTVNGSGFNAGAVAKLGSTALATTFVSATQLTCKGVTLASQQGTVANLIVTNGSPGNLISAAVPVAIGEQNPVVSASAAMRFLDQAGFGPRPADVTLVQQLGFQGWLAQQFAAPGGSLYQKPGGGVVNSMAARFLTNAVMGGNQLRQRVAFALSQFFVVSFNKLFYPSQMAPYQEMLYQNAFSTFPNLLGKVTLDPAMGVFLDMANNDKANPALGSVANENYAREVMQLFSIGTILLNANGTPQFQNGAPVPAYDQTTVQQFAKVFTGWTFAPAPGAPVHPHNNVYFLAPMVGYDPNHDLTAKTLLNGVTLPAGQTAIQDMNAALANLVAHQNVAPFVSKFLIQHLVTSNPSPAYVQRVATVFNDNGQGVKGDMQAVISAILLDTEARAGDAAGAVAASFGHLQEPALWIASMLRAMNGLVDDTNYFQWDLFNMNQDLFNAPSVFNYYSPQFRVSGVPGPEFQIQSPWVAVYRLNFVDSLFGAYSGTQATYGGGTTVDLTPWISLAGNPSALVDALDSTFTHGQMPAAMKQNIVTAVAGVNQGNLRAVQVGVYLILGSAFYQVMH